MGFTRAELKAQAKEQLKGNVWMYFLISLVAGLITSASSALFGVGIIFIGYPVMMGLCVCVIMNMTYGEKPQIEMIFEPFKKCYWKAVGLMLVEGILICLWSLLLVVPGIIKAYSYAQALNILNENPDMSVMDCISASKEMMKGHKWDLFVLELSFILWLLLVTVTFGIAAIYVTPYIALTEMNFYHRIKGNSAAQQPTVEA